MMRTKLNCMSEMSLLKKEDEQYGKIEKGHIPSVTKQSAGCTSDRSVLIHTGLSFILLGLWRGLHLSTSRAYLSVETLFSNLLQI